MTTRPVASEALHDIADIDLPDAGAAGDRRDDLGVVEDGARIVDRALIGLHLRFELRDQRALRVGLLRASRALVSASRM